MARKTGKMKYISGPLLEDLSQFQKCNELNNINDALDVIMKKAGVRKHGRP